MSRQFRRIYPPTGRQLFDGGQNSKFERSIIADNESPDCLNVVFTNGAVETRQGTSKLNPVSVGSFACDGLFTRRSRDTSETMVAFFGGSAFTLAGTTLTSMPSATSVFTAGVRVACAQYENHAFFGNGGAIPRKWNGTDYTRHGVYPPTTTATVASNAIGVLVGDYRYKVAFVNSALAGSDVGPVTSTFTAASATLRLTSIPVAPQSYGVSARRIYRNTTAASSTYKLVATLNDNSTTTYDDNAADTALGEVAPTDNGVPPNWSAIIYHQNRLFMNDPANPSYVWWTDLGEPYTVGSLNFKPVGDDASDLVHGFAVYDNSLIVFCENSITIGYLTGDDEDDWKWVKSRAPFGCKSPFSIFNYNDKVAFAATQNGKFAGFAAFSGDTTDTSATLLTVSTAGSSLTSDRIEPEMFNVQESYLNLISGMVYKNKAYIALPYDTGTTANNRYYLFDFSIANLKKSQEFSWVPNTGIYPSMFTVYGGELYYGSANAVGFIYQMESGTYSDDGNAIDSYYWTKEYAGFKEDTNFYKDYRFANLLVDKAGAYYMDIAARVNSDDSDGTAQQINLDPGGSLWGVMEWGVDDWGGGFSQEEMKLALGPLAGERIQFKFSNQNTAGQRFKVHGMNFSYNRKGYR